MERMERFQLPDHLLDELKCQLCCEYLSYPPITLHADTGSVCGRCPTLEAERDIKPLRESNYEILAKSLLLFPCRFKPQGCEKVFPMDKIPEHEAVCELKSFFCPVMPLGSCAWQGTPKECHMHFATDHQDLLLDGNRFELDLSKNYKINLLVEKDGVLFVLHNEFSEEDGKFYTGLYQTMESENKYKYSIKIVSGDMQKEFLMGEKNVLIYKDFIKTDLQSVSARIINEALHFPVLITCTIDIKESEKKENEESNIYIADAFSFQLDDEEVQIKKVEDDKMLLDIECPVCQEFMIPPIYQCQVGHSICGACKPMLRDCPSCRGPLGDIRNFTLEKLTEHMLYQCKHRFEGCTHRANSKEIKNHERDCTFAPLYCPFKEHMECSWKGHYKALIPHCRTSHENFLITEPLFIIIPYSNVGNSEEQRLTRFKGDLFRVRVGYNNEKRKVYGSVQLIGSIIDARQYMYEVQVTDLNTMFLQLLSKKNCGSIHEKKNEMTHCSTFSLDMVLPFISEDNHIHMKFEIINKFKIPLNNN